MMAAPGPGHCEDRLRQGPENGAARDDVGLVHPRSQHGLAVATRGVAAEEMAVLPGQGLLFILMIGIAAEDATMSPLPSPNSVVDFFALGAAMADGTGVTTTVPFGRLSACWGSGF